MQIDFALPTDNRMHRLCIDCRAEGVEQTHVAGKVAYHCKACGHTNKRAIYFNKHKFWADEHNVLWHESAGVFVRNQAGKYLFFQRTEYPFSLTVPAGHVDIGESAEIAAQRELEEEVGITTRNLKKAGVEAIHGDACSGGSDDHKWHIYVLQLPTDQVIKVREEGEKAVWLSLEEAKSKDLAFVIGYVVEHYGDKIDSL